MDRQTIAQLAWYMPRTAAAEDMAVGGSDHGLDAEQTESVLHFANCFANLSFGWGFARSLVDQELPFPAFLSGKDIYVWRAYNYLQGKPDNTIAAAVAFTLPSNNTLRTQINALLVSDDVDANYVAYHMGLDADAVDAYEKLFFNVIDRKKDHAFIANLVYPEGRLVEGFADYLEHVKLDELMMRAGFTRGAKHVLYTIGVGKNPFTDLDVMSGSNKMDEIFIAEGCLYATMGWQNTWHNNRPIENARLSIQASKMAMAGKDMTIAGGGFDGLGIGEMLRDGLIMDATIKAETKAKLYQEGVLDSK